MYSKIKVSDMQKLSRKAVSRFERTEEWRLMEADLKAGLKPLEVAQVLLSAEDKKRYKITNRRTVARFVKKYVQENKLRFHRVKSFTHDGADIVAVIFEPPVATAKRSA